MAKFNLNLLAQALQPMPYAPIGDQLILLTAIQHAEARENGSLILSLMNGIEVSLTPEEAVELEEILQAGIEHAQAQAARRAGQELGLIQVPGIAH
jgi:hypothetical protein